MNDAVTGWVYTSNAIVIPYFSVGQNQASLLLSVESARAEIPNPKTAHSINPTASNSQIGVSCLILIVTNLLSSIVPPNDRNQVEPHFVGCLPTSLTRQATDRPLMRFSYIKCANPCQ